MADAVDRRRLLFLATIGMATTSGLLAWLAWVGDAPVIGVMLVAGLAAAISAIEQPARMSAVARLVPEERLAAAVALNQLSFNAASIAGPAVGGILLATVGLAGAYVADVATFGVALVAIAAMAPIRPLASAVRPGLDAVREGLRFVAQRRVILSTFVMDLDANVLASPVAVFPILALDVFRVGETGLGFLAAAPAVGAFAGALLSGWIPRIRRIGRAVAISVAVWGGAVALTGAFALPAIASFELVLVCLAVAGAADLLSTVLRGTLVQLETPDELRGRVSATHILAVRSGPRLGDMRATIVASVVGAPVSVLAGGLACMAGVLAVVRGFPELAAYRREPGEPPA